MTRGLATAVLAAALLVAGGAGAAAPDPATATGRMKFNSNCGGCHGEDAVQADRKQDLRLLQRRYADKADEVFATTVKDGRPDKGMPSWAEALSPTDLGEIYAFVKTVQTP